MHSTSKRPATLHVAAIAAAVMATAACSPKTETATEAGSASTATARASILPNPRETIDHAKSKLDAASELEAKRREQMEAQAK